MGPLGLVRARASPAVFRTSFALAQPLVGFVWAHASSSGLPVRAPIKSLCKPSQIPYRFPDWARTGLARSNPALAPAGLAIDIIIWDRVWDVALDLCTQTLFNTIELLNFDRSKN